MSLSDSLPPLIEKRIVLVKKSLSEFNVEDEMPGTKRSSEINVPAVERQVDDLLVLHHRAQRGVRGLKQFLDSYSSLTLEAGSLKTGP